MLRGVGDMISGLGDLPAPVRNAALAFAAVLAAAGPIVGIAAAIAGAFALLGTAAAPILLVTAAVAGLAAAIAALATTGDLSGIWAGLQARALGDTDHDCQLPVVGLCAQDYLGRFCFCL